MKEPTPSKCIFWLSRHKALAAVKSLVRPVAVVLDIGCGIKPQSFFSPRIQVCCDPHAEYLESLVKESSGAAENRIFIKSTAAQASTLFPDKSIDSVFMLDVIEHMDKSEGLRVLRECERITRKQIVIFSPLGFVPQHFSESEPDAWGMYGGKWQNHKSGWLPEDFDESWIIIACSDFHEVDAHGKPFIPPAGAFWAVKNLDGIDASLEVNDQTTGANGQHTTLVRLTTRFGRRIKRMLSLMAR